MYLVTLGVKIGSLAFGLTCLLYGFEVTVLLSKIFILAMLSAATMRVLYGMEEMYMILKITLLAGTGAFFLTNFQTTGLTPTSQKNISVIIFGVSLILVSWYWYGIETSLQIIRLIFIQLMALIFTIIYLKIN